MAVPAPAVRPAPAQNRPAPNQIAPKPASVNNAGRQPYRGHGSQSAGSDRNSGPRPKKEPKTLFARSFKSVGTRTYTAEVKEAGNGNQFIVLTESKPDAN